MQNAEGAQRKEHHQSSPTFVIGEYPLIYLQMLLGNNECSLLLPGP